MDTKELICLDCREIHEEEDCAVLVMDADPSEFWGQPLVSRKQVEVLMCPSCGSEELDEVIEFDSSDARARERYQNAITGIDVKARDRLINGLRRSQ